MIQHTDIQAKRQTSFVRTCPLTPLSFLCLLTFLIPFSAPASSQTLPLSDSATASVITCGPGNDFYTTFGHSAIRICDPSQGIDHVYNYGTFDFDTPNFYLKFAQGQLNYCLSRSPMNLFMATYDYERRAVWEQPLNLTRQEVNNLFIMLEWNYMPDNRYYRYDFFRDNCATRVRDMVEAACGKQKATTGECDTKSYRKHVHEAAAGGCLEWWTLGVDLLLGLRTDLDRTVSEAMFYPMVMMGIYDNATRDGQPLVSGNTQLLQDTRPPLRRSFPPIVVFALLCVAAALLTWKHLWPRWADRLLFILAGIVGLFLLYMWLGTSHWCTKWNLNILWASPLLILIAIQLERSPRWALWLQEGCFAVAAVWVAVCGLSPALLPLILTLALRVACLIPRTPQQRQQRH